MNLAVLKFSVCTLFLLTSFSFFATKIYAIEDPLSKNNNFFGIHILFTSELEKAKDLTNSSGGDWGYVTIPLQAGDRDLDKWQTFMNEARNYHLIPIIRLSTEGYYADTQVWRKPNEYDVVDFANFLNSLTWPTKNRYIILFNEVNRFDEWGGEAPDPAYYADIVSFSYDTFKSRSSDFYIILGGFDNAAPNDGKKYINEFVYLRSMVNYNPDIFNKIDGFASHSYPNPGFEAYPNIYNSMGVSSYKFEYDLINQYSSVKKPVFITETGWDSTKLGEDTVANYFKYTYDNIWGKDRDKIVAITPFLLESSNGPFDKFSFYKNGISTAYFKIIQRIAKTKGEPQIIPAPSGSEDIPISGKNFVKTNNSEPPFSKIFGEKSKNDKMDNLFKNYLKTIFGVN